MLTKLNLDRFKLFKYSIFVTISVFSMLHSARASSSVILIETGETAVEEAVAQPVSTAQKAERVEMVINNITLQDLLPSLSAVTGASFQSSGNLNYKLEKFAFRGKTTDLAPKIATLLPVGYYGAGDSYDFYGLDTKVSKTYDPSQVDVLKLIQRFNLLTVQSSPKLGFTRLSNGSVVFEGPKLLFTELERDIAQPKERPTSSTSLIKGGLKTTE